MTTTRLPKTITAGALLATPIPPVKWIIPGLLPAGLAIFAGPSKAGKSWLTLWLCLQISQGKSVWGREIEPRTVLYFSLEDTLGRLQERLYKLVDAEEDPERLILQTESHGIGQGLEEQIVSFIHTYPDISLIVIDTLQKVRKGDQNGSMYANDYRDIGALKELADKYGILAEHAFVHDHKFSSLQAIVDYRKGLSQHMETLAAQRAEIVKQMRRKDVPPELADRRTMLTCKIAELRKEDKIAEGAIKRIQRTRESNRIDRENQEHHTNHNRRRNRSRQR